MIYALGIAAAAFLGVGWVLQQRVAARDTATQQMSWQALRTLIGHAEWWGGIAAMAVGQTLAAWALQEGPITLVEPLLVGCLLFAFGLSAVLGRHPIRLHEVVGTVLVAGAVGLFLGVADPRPAPHYTPGWPIVLVATGGVCVVAAVVVAAGALAARSSESVGVATSAAAAAGMFYALQDVATRGAIDAVRSSGLMSLVGMTWPYVLLFGAVVAVLLSQLAFRAARLDWSLPPTAAMQPLAGVALGMGLLGDEMLTSPTRVALEALSIVIGVAGVIVIGRRMRMMRRAWERKEKAPAGGRTDQAAP